MPVFTIKARDALAIPAIRAYARLCYEHGLDDQAREVFKAEQEIRDWQRRNIDATKLPDHPHRPIGDQS